MSAPFMKLSKIRVYPTFKESGLLASCDVLINNFLYVNDIQLFKGSRGFFIKYPSRLMNNGYVCEVVAPTHRIQRLQLRAVLIRSYKKALQQAAEEDIQLSLFPQAA